MFSEELSLYDQLRWVKFRIQILGLIEDKLREIKALAERVRDDNLCDGDIMRIQVRVNELIKDIAALDKIHLIEAIH